MMVDISKVKWNIDADGTWLLVKVPSVAVAKGICDGIEPNKQYTIQITKKTKKRSKDANAYMWEMCQQLAEVNATTKEEIYRAAIKDVGVFKDFQNLSKKDAQTLRTAWEMLGTGWLTEQVDYMPDGKHLINMPVGAYWYSCADTEDKGRAEAEYMYENCLKGKQFEYPIYIDIEETRWQTNKKDGVTDAAIAFCDWLEKKGYFVGVYASDISGFKDKMHIDRLKPYALWVARYNGQPTYVTDYGIHQDTSSYRINGYDGALDHNICYVDYPSIIRKNGLNGYAKNSAPTNPPESKPQVTDNFLPAKRYWTRGDKDERIGRLAKFMRKNFPAYTSVLALGNLYGKNLEKSIKEFQRRTGLEADGNCGPKTYAKLKEYGFKP